jgi:transposase-like protein
MKTKDSMLPTPDDLTLDDVWQRFPDDDKARRYLQEIRWPNGPVCPHCKNDNQEKIWKLTANKDKKIRGGLYQCNACGKQFTVTVGTIFEDSHIPLRKWLVAWWLLCSSKKGISSLQIQRMLGLGSYRTALFMMHRIRHALRDPAFGEKFMGTVECDETYVGGKQHYAGPYAPSNKIAVVALVKRGGDVRSQVLPRVTGKNLRKFVHDNVVVCSRVNTDEHWGYQGLAPKYDHQTVKHGIREYARGDVHVNTAESCFSLLKRGIIGTFHNVSAKHLPLYLAEFDHRWNHRKTTDGERTIAGLKKAEGKRLTYKAPMKSKLAK